MNTSSSLLDVVFDSFLFSHVTRSSVEVRELSSVNTIRERTHAYCE